MATSRSLNFAAASVVAGIMIGLVMIYHATSFYRDQGLVTSLEHILSCPDRLEQTKEVRFIRHTERYDLTMAGDPHWEAILPSNGGFITVGDGANGSTTIMGISMFHQLHCLQIIRKAFQGYVDMGDKVDLRDEGHGMQDAHAHHHGGQRHWVHCLDYLAQCITCAADNTLEPARGPENEINGYDVVHQCHNADHLWRMTGV